LTAAVDGRWRVFQGIIVPPSKTIFPQSTIAAVYNTLTLPPAGDATEIAM
jgi:hypothetical protein